MGDPLSSSPRDLILSRSCTRKRTPSQAETISFHWRAKSALISSLKKTWQGRGHEPRRDTAVVLPSLSGFFRQRLDFAAVHHRSGVLTRRSAMNTQPHIYRPGIEGRTGFVGLERPKLCHVLGTSSQRKRRRRAGFLPRHCRPGRKGLRGHRLLRLSRDLLPPAVPSKGGRPCRSATQTSSPVALRWVLVGASRVRS